MYSVHVFCIMCILYMYNSGAHTCADSHDITKLYMPSGASGWTVEEVDNKMKYTSSLILIWT